MAYRKNMRSAANRHFQDAEALFENRRHDNAGYHYGISAECALKAAMERVGIPTDAVEVNGRDAYYIHFPYLKRIPVEYAGRLSQGIANVLAGAAFLQNWQIAMRYSHDNAVQAAQCSVWREQVSNFNGQCGGI